MLYIIHIYIYIYIYIGYFNAIKVFQKIIYTLGNKGNTKKYFQETA